MARDLSLSRGVLFVSTGRRPRDVSLCNEVADLVRVLWSGRWAVVTPYALVYAVWRFVPQFRSYQQQDAQEFFSYLIDSLHAEPVSIRSQSTLFSIGDALLFTATGYGLDVHPRVFCFAIP